MNAHESQLVKTATSELGKSFFRFLDDGFSTQARLCLTANQVIIHEVDSHGETVLMRCVALGSLTLVATALECNPDVNAAAPDGFTALHLAARRGLVVLCELLIARGADVNRQTTSGVTPFALAKSERFEFCAKLLVGSGARV